MDDGVYYSSSLSTQQGNNNIDPVEIIICEPERSLFESLKSSLMREGLGHIHGVFGLENFQKALNNNLPDLILIDHHMEDPEKVIHLIKDIRKAILGHNPFVPIIATMWDTTVPSIAKMVDAGVDAIIAKPMSVQQILNRFNSLLQGRKPFVVSTQYIGPERRSNHDRVNILPLIEPPNTLRHKKFNQSSDPQSIRKLISSAVVVLNYQRLKRNALHFYFLIELIKHDYQYNQLKQGPGYLKNLYEVLMDLMQRLPGSEFIHLLELCQELQKSIFTLKDNFANLSQAMLTDTTKIALQIAAQFNKDRSIQDIQTEVDNSVATYLDRQAKLQNE